VRGQEEILRERFTHQRCAACGANQRKEDVITLAHRASRWLLLVTCWRCQHRGIFIATFPQDELAPPPPHIHPLDANTLPFVAHSAPDSTPITRGDVDAMRQFLLGFNGDFQALFGGDSR
jgi:hypothetical protein